MKIALFVWPSELIDVLRDPKLTPDFMPSIHQCYNLVNCCTGFRQPFPQIKRNLQPRSRCAILSGSHSTMLGLEDQDQQQANNELFQP